MSLDEELSRLLAGDLPEAEARALRARIEREPDVARAHAEMAALVGALEALPETAPAPELRVVPIRTPFRRAMAAAPWLLAAAACAAWLLTPARDADLLLAAGDAWIAGDLTLAAADVSIDLDGTARIRVEPPAHEPRVAGREAEMTRGHLLAGVAGAAVTVAVIEGTAIVRAANHEPVELGAGDEGAFGGDGTPAATDGPLPTDRAALERRLVMLQRDLAETQKALELEQFSGALTRGQLAAEQGTPSEWPDAVPPTMSADHFSAELEQRLGDLPGVDVHTVDCSEYPCIAAVKVSNAANPDTWGKEAEAAIAAWALEAYGDDHSLSVNRSRFVHDDDEARYLVFGAHSEGENDAVNAREKWRIDGIVEQLGEEMEDGATAGTKGASGG